MEPRLDDDVCLIVETDGRGPSLREEDLQDEDVVSTSVRILEDGDRTEVHVRVVAGGLVGL